MKGHAKKNFVSNTTLKDALQAIDYLVIRHEEGEHTLEAGTFKAFKKSAGVIRCEMAKQHPQRRKTIRVEITQDQERIDYLRRSRMDDMIHG